MNVAREFKQVIDNFCAGLAKLQAQNEPAHNHVVVEDGYLIWVKLSRRFHEEDAAEMEKLGWEMQSDGFAWSLRLEIPNFPPGYKCPDRLNSEREIEELHAQF